MGLRANWTKKGANEGWVVSLYLHHKILASKDFGGFMTDLIEKTAKVIAEKCKGQKFNTVWSLLDCCSIAVGYMKNGWTPHRSIVNSNLEPTYLLYFVIFSGLYFNVMLWGTPYPTTSLQPCWCSLNQFCCNHRGKPVPDQRLEHGE